jgi:hypothetical protein
MPQDFSGQDLRGRSFKGQDLTGANFSHTNICGTDFTNAILTGANFSHAKAGLRASLILLLIGVILLVGVINTSDSVISTQNLMESIETEEDYYNVQSGFKFAENLMASGTYLLLLATLITTYLATITCLPFGIRSRDQGRNISLIPAIAGLLILTVLIIVLNLVSTLDLLELQYRFAPSLMSFCIQNRVHYCSVLSQSQISFVEILLVLFLIIFFILVFHVLKTGNSPKDTSKFWKKLVRNAPFTIGFLTALVAFLIGLSSFKIIADLALECRRDHICSGFLDPDSPSEELLFMLPTIASLLGGILVHTITKTVLSSKIKRWSLIATGIGVLASIAFWRYSLTFLNLCISLSFKFIDSIFLPSQSLLLLGFKIVLLNGCILFLGKYTKTLPLTAFLVATLLPVPVLPLVIIPFCFSFVLAFATKQTNFNRANLTNANFTQAHLSHSNFNQAILVNTNFSGAKF